MTTKFKAFALALTVAAGLAGAVAPASASDENYWPNFPVVGGE